MLFLCDSARGSGWRAGARGSGDTQVEQRQKEFSHLVSPQGARVKLGYFIKPMAGAKETDKPF
jgi:hypothetical protein